MEAGGTAPNEPKEPKEPPDKPGLPTIAAAAAALVSGIGLLTLTGSLGRVQRNSGDLFAIAVGMVIAGSALWMFASLLDQPARKRHGRGWKSRAFGVLMTLFGLVLGFYAAIEVADDTEQAAVAVKFNERDRSLTGTAKVGNLSSGDRLSVSVEGLIVNREGGYEVPESNTRPLYEAYLGPDKDGDAAHEFRAPIPPGRYSAVGVRAHTAPQGKRAQGCGRDQDPPAESELQTGCVIVRLPTRTNPLQLTASWEKPGRSASWLKLTADAADLPAERDDALVLLRVVGVGGNKLASLYTTVVGVPPSGIVKREIRLPIARYVRTVCARVETISAKSEMLPRLRCPIAKAARSGTVELKVPRS